MRYTYIKLFFSALFWGASAIAGKWLFTVLRPAQVTFLRFALAALALGGVVTLARRQAGPVSLGEHARLAVLDGLRVPVKRLPPWQFERSSAAERLARHFGVQDLAGLVRRT